MILTGIKSLCKIHSDHLFLFQIYFKETKNHQVSQRKRSPIIGHPHYEALFGGKPRAGLEPWRARGWGLDCKIAVGGPWQQQR